MRSRSTSAVAALAVLGALLLAVSSAGAAAEAATQTYLVTLVQEPAVAYEGGVAGLAATKPGKGRKLDKGSADVERYVGRDVILGIRPEDLEDATFAHDVPTRLSGAVRLTEALGPEMIAHVEVAISTTSSVRAGRAATDQVRVPRS